tara:strand:- start:405 stop:3293 length:2889 start_codon:yes stop_codon:yes gene_type:complete
MADGLGKNLNDANKSAKDLNKNLKDSTKAANDLGTSFNDYRETLRSIASELGKQTNNLKDARKEYTKLDSIARKLSDQEAGINRLKDDQLDKLQKQAQSSVEEIKNRADALQFDKLRAKTGADLMKLNGAAFDATLKSLAANGKITEEEANLIKAKKEGFKIEEEFLEKLNEEVEIRKESNRLMGIGGGILKGLNELGGKFAQSLNLPAVTEDMQEMADAIARNEKSAGIFGGKMKVLGVGLTSAFKNVGGALMDPSVLFGALIKGFKDVDKAATDFARQTGQDMNTMATSVDSLNMGYVNMADYIKAASELTKELAFNANDIFSPEDILEVAQMTDEMGMAGKEAANLAKFSKLNNMSVKEQNKSLIAGVNSFNAQNKSAVNARKVLDDVANVSADIRLLYAGYPEELGKAATAAADLGLSLEQVDKIADSLLQFEESISAELKAELLTGKQLNLEKAREAALTNDIETLSKELSKNIGTSADFAKMGRIEQESLAKAMGMTKQQLAETLLAQDLQNNLSEDSLTKAQKQTLESMKNREAQEKIAQALGKIGQAFAPIVGFIADIVSNSYVLYSLLGVALITKLGGLKNIFVSSKEGIKGMIDGAKNLRKTLVNAFQGGTDAAKKFYKGGQFMPGGKRAPKGGAFADALPKSSENIAKSADKTKGIQADQGKGIKGFLEGLGDGLASIGKKFPDVVKGGAALGLSLIALGGGFAVAGMFIANTDPTQMIAFSAALGILGLTVAVMGKTGGEIIKGALALGILAVGLIPAAFAFSLLAGVDASSILAFAIALPILGLAVLGLGLIFTNPITMFLFGAGIAGLLALSLAIIPLAAAFGSLADANIEGIMGSLVGLASVAPDLMGIGVGLMSIAAGLGAISIAGLLAMPTLMALTALGSVSEGLGSIFGGGGETTAEDDPMVEKLNELNNNILKLISVVEAGGDVVMDGAVVGKTISMASSRIG